MDGGITTAVNVGWLWFDDDPKTSLDDKLGRAEARFRHKFGRSPRVCYVSSQALNGQEPGCVGLQVRSACNVLPGHFLFVVEERTVAAD